MRIDYPFVITLVRSFAQTYYAQENDGNLTAAAESCALDNRFVPNVHRGCV